MIQLRKSSRAFPSQPAKGQARGVVEATIDPEHVARAVVYMAGLPLDVNVQFITAMATKLPFIGRG